MILEELLKETEYDLNQFEDKHIKKLLDRIYTRELKKGPTPYSECFVREKGVQLKPEEVIRQLYLIILHDEYGYSFSRMKVEYTVNFGREKKRADIVIFDKDRVEAPYLIVELKKPKLKDGKDQLKSYCNATGAPIGVWTNGQSISYYHRKDPNYFEDITDIPKNDESLVEIIRERFTIQDLIENDKLVNEKKSLKDLIKELEDEVLANAGVDVFEEVFKLIFTKLYDEWLSGRNPSRYLEFRNIGQTDTELKNKIQRLFDDARNKWEGVFTPDDRINLSPSHLSIAISSLQNVKLFNSNLEVVDEAFEYLINKNRKGDKGQFFTPRYVIDMCVKMINPQEDEYLIDTAAGSSGFTVHSMFHVWQKIFREEGLDISNLFTLEKKPYRCIDYVQKRLFSIDFDEKAVRVARTLNLIAGDGQTNVLHLNTLDYQRWKEITEQKSWMDTYYEGFKRLRRLNTDNQFRDFKFDVLMANPPFAGDIKESRILSRYETAQKKSGGIYSKVSRHILFIERNISFLKPGGRMAIVLPQGLFNNISDQNIREYISERCRILAVVGLHENTFEPHTGTKTSVLFLQRWNENPDKGPLCPKQEDYNIFFATMGKKGKDSSGDKIYVQVQSNGNNSTDDDILNSPNLAGSKDYMLDDHGHLVIDHDLFKHPGREEDGIAEKFTEFAKEENLSFV